MAKKNSKYQVVLDALKAIVEVTAHDTPSSQEEARQIAIKALEEVK